MIIASAFANLTDVERAFATRYAQAVCAAAEREGVRPMDVLTRTIDERALGAVAADLLRRHGVQAAIVELVREIAIGNTFTIEAALNELWAIAFSNIDDYLADFADGDRSEIDWSKVPRHKLAAVKSVQVERFGDGRQKRKIEFHDKLAAIKAGIEYVQQLPPGHRYKQLSFSTPGQSATLPATISDNEAADRYARLLDASE